MTAAAGKRRRCKEVGGELGVVGGGSGSGGRSFLATFLRRRKEREVRRVCGWIIEGGGAGRMEGLRESLEASTLGFRVFLPLSSMESQLPCAGRRSVVCAGRAVE
jgi:hypothetical protein